MTLRDFIAEKLTLHVRRKRKVRPKVRILVAGAGIQIGAA